MAQRLFGSWRDRADVGGPPFDARGHLREIVRSSPERVSEVVVLLNELYEQYAPIEASLGLSSLSRPNSVLRLSPQPVSFNLSIIFPKLVRFPKSFRTYETTEGEFLDVLPLPVTMELLSEIIEYTSKFANEGYPNTLFRLLRFLGPMGIGKSYAAFLALLSVFGFCHNAGFCVVLDPLDMIANPKSLIELLIFMLHRLDGEALVEELLPLYESADRSPISDGIALKTLIKCREHCARLNRPFICIIDQENSLYKTPTLPEVPLFAAELISGTAAHSTVFISSATSPEVRIPRSPGIVNQQTPLYFLDEFASSSSILDLEVSHLLTEEQVSRIARWKHFFGGEEEFLRQIEIRSRGVYLEISKILEHFASTEPAIHTRDPWGPFFNSPETAELYRTHRQCMEESLSIEERGADVYTMLVALLDFHLEATPGDARLVGKWLWAMLRFYAGIHYNDGELLVWVTNLIDGRLMSVSIDETPRSMSDRASFIIRKFPSDLYLSTSSIETALNDLADVFRPYAMAHKRFNALKGYMLEDIVLEKFLFHGAIKVRGLMKLDTPVEDDWMKLFMEQDIGPAHRVIISEESISSSIHLLMRRRVTRYNEWIFLVPSSHFFPLLDFAIMFIPTRQAPPVLFPIQVTQSIMGHDPSDVLFRSGTIKHQRINPNPLLEAFNKETGGRGRVQFLWIGADMADVTFAAKSRRFDKDSWFCMIDDFCSTIRVTPATQNARNYPLFNSIGYSSGEAIQAALDRQQHLLAESTPLPRPRRPRAHRGRGNTGNRGGRLRANLRLARGRR